MRKTVFAVVVLGLALVIQLTVLNGLRLPGGGVPDLVLVLVASLAMADGPLRGMITGFAAGLCLDLAPPGSAVLGEYALIFCLAGWAAGKLSGLVVRSAVLSIAMLAGVVVLAEALVAGLSLALDPAQVSLATVRHVLPYSVAYDLLILPFALCLSILARSWAARAAAWQTAGGTLVAAGAAGVAGAGHAGRKGKRNQPRQPRLAEGFARPHDGWVGSKPSGLAGRTGARRRPVPPRGLRPANGVAGSAASGPPRRPALGAPPVNLRLAARRRRDGALGNTVGSSLGRHPGLHPGLRSTPSRGFRPHGGTPGGSAATQSAALVQPTWRRPVSVKFGTRRGDGSVGQRLPASLSSLIPSRSRRVAAPRFRSSSAVSHSAATRLNAGRMGDQHTIMSARRRNAPLPKLRLGSGRRGDRMPSGSVRGVRRSVRPSSPRFRSGSLPGSARRRAGKRPRFGYGRRSVLSFLARRPGGKWLASRRVGTRAGVFLIGKRTGGVR